MLTVFSAFTFAQGGGLNLSITLKDHQLKPMPGVAVWMVENMTNEKVGQTTNAAGICNFQLTSGNSWHIEYKDMVDERTYEVPPRGTRTVERTLSYLPPEFRDERQPAANRNGITFQELLASTDCTGPPARPNSRVVLKVETKGDAPMANINVKLVSVKLKKRWSGRTDARGKACFVVPPNEYFEVDVDGLEAYDYVNSIREGASATLVVKYSKSTVDEIFAGDTIRQDLYKNPSPSFTHALMTITLKTPNRQPLEGEEIYWDEVDGTKVYAATTDAEGRAQFLLKKGKKYMLNFKYEREVSLLDATKMGSISTGEGEYIYKGSKNIEEYFRTADRNSEGFITQFMESGAKEYFPSPFDVTPTKYGYELQLPARAPASTPAIDDDRLLISGGSYSREFFCFDTESGKYKWGLKLDDGGASSAAIEDGIVLINTYSCTLYAIDAKTGKLIWSKWMASSIYSSPSVADGKVYVTYENDLTEANSVADDEFVLACFDLKTGKLLWQKWVDHEALAAPVIEGGAVYMTTLAGSLYKFDAASGRQIHKIGGKFTTPPTVVKGKVYVSARASEEQPIEEVCIYDASNLRLVKKPSGLVGMNHIEHMEDMGGTGSMNYNGSRMTWYKGLNYNVIGGKLICSRPETGAIVWSAMLPVKAGLDKERPVAALPVVMNDRVIVNLAGGQIFVYHAQTGKKLKEYDTGRELWTQASIDQGVIYAGTKDGQVVRIDTKDESITGWPMWGLNGAHNTVVNE